MDSQLSTLNNAEIILLVIVQIVEKSLGDKRFGIE